MPPKLGLPESGRLEPGSIKLYRSNRTDKLVDQLARLLAKSPSGPLQSEWLVVPGRGMAVWLAQQLAMRFGIWAGAEMLYPRNLIERVYASVVGEEVAEQLARYGKGALSWALFAALGEARDAPMQRLAAYLDGDEEGSRRFALAQTIAMTFDRYLAYRPAMLRAWQDDRDEVAAEHGEQWQPVLWRALVERLGPDNLATLEQRALRVLMSRNDPLPQLPPRLIVFGLGTLPPMYVRCMAALAHHLELHLFLPSMARGYWADAWQQQRDEAMGVEGAEPVNPLIASLGRLGADMQRVLSDQLEQLGVAEEEPAGELFAVPGTTTVLRRLQTDLLELRCGQHIATSSHPSVAVHACHSAMREVEVLHDQLLSVLTVGGDLAPEDVVVMLADVETYAPLVEAVFNRERGHRRFIPFHIADRSLRHDSAALDTLNAVIDLVGARVTASQLLDLLNREPLRQRLRFGREDIDTMTHWVIESGIRWGVDAEHRRAHHQPAHEQNTWRFGLRRLLLGYAMAPAQQATFEGVLPYDKVEGKQAAVLGRFALFCEWLFEQLVDLEQPRDVHAWQSTLVALLDELLGRGPDAEAAAQPILRGLQEVVAAADIAGMTDLLSIQAMRDALMAHVDERRAARGFMAGGVTFCAMVPMRNIPFQVVCLVGMSDSDFPRRGGVSDFDLMAKPGAQRPGDRTRRDDDRFLFLEALAAAQRRLIITYTGQSIRDNSQRAPSVVVSELIEYLEQSQPALAGKLITHHPLQPFSPRYFQSGPEELFSYAGDLCRGAARIGQLNAPPPSFLQGEIPLAPPSELLRLDELVRFFRDPVRFTVRDRLSIDLSERDAEVVDREPITLDPLERYRLGDELVGQLLAGMEDGETLALANASGQLPQGAMGGFEHKSVLKQARHIVRLAEQFMAGRPPLSVPVELPLADGAVLVGELRQVWRQGLLQHQYSRVRAKHQLAFWLRHLALCAASSEPPDHSLLVGRGLDDKKPLVAYRFRPVPDATGLLTLLVNIYREGQRTPLPLFIEPALRYARTLRRGKSEGDARGAAQRALEADYDNDAYLQHGFAGKEALIERLQDDSAPGVSFALLSQHIFNPLLDHIEEL